MPTRPSSSDMALSLNTSRTSPLPLCTRSCVPLAVAMPAASWPRCWRTVRPSYSAVATSVVATMPMMPHMAVFSRCVLRDWNWWPAAAPSRVRADHAVDAEPGLHLRLELLGVVATRHRPGLDPGQAAAVGGDGFGEGVDAHAAQAVAQAGGLVGI